MKAVSHASDTLRCEWFQILGKSVNEQEMGSSGKQKGTRGRRRLWAGETRSRGRPRVGEDQG